MEKLIPLINKLQEIFYRTKVPFSVEMPQIVVIGGQSSGKSSVLESIVGRDFLPRGTNIVTRRPIIIQLSNTPHAAQDWIEFSHRPGEKYFDFFKAREEIEMDTDRVCGRNKDISSAPLIVKVYSRNVVDLTLVDLPGMTKIPTGDQPIDIERKILDLCYQFVTPKTAIIMAVSPANQDLANSDALKLARKVDPYGERTIGVLTKIDLMDDGTNCLDVIQGKVYPLKLGYIGVVCRSQKDILSGKPIKEALAAEENFFRTSNIYAPLASRLGTAYLCKNLNVIIVKHIKRCLPIIRSKITSMLYQKEKELKSLQMSGDDGALSEQQLVLNIIAKYAASYAEFLEGRFVKDTASELKGGSRLNYIYYEVYTTAISGIDPFDALTDDDIKTAIRNASSLRPNLFVPEVAFEVLSKQQINRLESPSLQCVQLVYEELRRIVNEIEMQELHRFQNLRKKIIDVMFNLLNKQLTPTNTMVRNLIQVQDAYINTYHPDFMGGANGITNVFDINSYNRERLSEEALRKNSDQVFEDVGEDGKSRQVKPMKGQAQTRQPFGGEMLVLKDPKEEQQLDNGRLKNFNDYEINKYMQKNIKPIHLPDMPTYMRAEDRDPGQSSPRSQLEVHIIKSLIVSYFDTVRKSMNDMVPKTIMAFLVNKTKNLAQRELVAAIYNDQVELKTLLSEDNATMKKREQCKEMVTTLRKSLEFLNEVRDFYFESEPF